MDCANVCEPADRWTKALSTAVSVGEKAAVTPNPIRTSPSKSCHSKLVSETVSDEELVGDAAEKSGVDVSTRKSAAAER